MIEKCEYVKPLKPLDKIWRYMDFGKFVSLVNTSSLFFCRADKLGDPYEGSVSRANIKLRPEIYPKEIIAYLNSPTNPVKHWARFSYINCWHLNKNESDAMWRIYQPSGSGIAIQTTYKKFLKVLSESQYDVITGKVNYLDYDTDWMRENSISYRFFCKQKAFIHEKEIRALIKKIPLKDNSMEIDIEQDTPFGIHLPVDLNNFIDNVYVSPTTPSWMVEVIQGVMGKWNLNKKIIHSTLNDRIYEPVY